MTSNVRDVTPDKPPHIYEYWGNTLLRRRLQGTFCFPFVSGFGCGASEDRQTGEEWTSEASIGASGFGLTGSLKVGNKITAASKWSYNAERCEYCRPTICFEGTLGIWRTQSWSSLFENYTEYKWDLTSPGDILNNCVQNAPECNCSTNEQSSSVGSGPQLEESAVAAKSTLILPGSLNQEKAAASSPEDTLNLAKEILFPSSRRRAITGGSELVGIASPGESINWLGQATDNIAISLLSPQSGNSDIDLSPIISDGKPLVLVAVVSGKDTSVIASVTNMTDGETTDAVCTTRRVDSTTLVHCRFKLAQPRKKKLDTFILEIDAYNEERERHAKITKKLIQLPMGF